MREWYASAGGSTFVFRATYMPWLALAIVVAVLGMVWLFVAVARERRHAETLAALGAILLWTAAASTFSACGSVKLDDSYRADNLFRPLWLMCVVAFAIALATLVVGIIVTISNRRMPLATLSPGIASMVASLAAIPLAVLQVVELGKSYLPVLDVPAPVGFHVGIVRRLKPQLFHRTEAGARIPFEDAQWTCDDIEFEATAPGTVERKAIARNGPFAVSTKVTAKAHDYRGSPWLPLRVGNEWHYALTTTTRSDGTRYLLIFEGGPGNPNVKTAGVVIAIEPASPRDGWHEYTLVVRTEEGDSLGTHVLRPIDGETYFYDRTATEVPDEPDPTDPKSALRVLLEVDPGSTPIRGCRMANLGAGRCQMGGASEDILPPPVVDPDAKKKKPPSRPPKAGPPPPAPARVPTEYALAGPSHLATSWEDHGGAASWIVGLVTMGLIIPTGMSGGEEYVLMRTVRAGS